MASWVEQVNRQWDREDELLRDLNEILIELGEAPATLRELAVFGIELQEVRA